MDFIKELGEKELTEAIMEYIAKHSGLVAHTVEFSAAPDTEEPKAFTPAVVKVFVTASTPLPKVKARKKRTPVLSTVGEH